MHHTLVADLVGRESAATAVGLCLAVSSLGVIAGAPLVGTGAAAVAVALRTPAPTPALAVGR